MIKKIKTEEAVGQALLHDITGITENGFKGVMFRRNQIIQIEDVEKLKDIGKEHIYVGTLEEDEIHEEDAVIELLPFLLGENLKASEISEGKVNVQSMVDGVLEVNSSGLFELNMIGDYTVASKKNFDIVTKQDKICGVRIVPLWTTKDQVKKAKEVAQKNFPIFTIKPFNHLRVGIIITGDEVYYGRIKDRFEPVLREKLSKFDSEIIDVIKCPDDIDRIKQAIKGFMDFNVDLIILTGGMSVDPDDLTPTAIKESNAEIIIQGLPVQPGNMLTIGKLDQTILVGVPGATIHSKVTAFDFALPRFFAKIDLRKEDFIRMGEGGLL